VTLTRHDLRRTPALLRPYRMIWAYRRLIWTSTRQLFVSRYAGTALGKQWIWLGPTLFLVLYAVVFQFLIKGEALRFDDLGYLAQVTAGLAAFLTLAQAMTAGCSSFSEGKGLLLNAVFPAELIPLRDAIVAAVPLEIGMIGAVVLGILANGPSWPLLLLPLLLLAFAGFVIGVVWSVSLLNLFIRDFSQIVTYLMMVLLTATPIGFSYRSVHGLMKVLIDANPLSYYVIPIEDVVAYGSWPPLGYVVGGMVMAVIGFHGLFAVFQKVKRAALDYI